MKLYKLNWFLILLPAVLIIGISTFLWLGLKNYEDNQVRFTVQIESENLRNSISTHLESRIIALQNLAKRWSIDSSSLNLDANLYIAHYQSCQYILLFDKLFNYKQIAKSSTAAQSLNLEHLKKIRQVLSNINIKNKEFPSVVVSNSVEIIPGYRYFLVLIPIVTESNINGFIVGIFDVTTFISNTISKNFTTDYSLEIYDDNKELYLDHLPIPKQQNKFQSVTKLNIHNAIWELKVSPKVEKINKEKTYLPVIILVLGFLMGAILSWSMYLAQREKQGRIILEKTNQDLENHILARKEVEVELARSNKELEQFAYIASHDLQEPLHMITSFTQLLQDEYMDKLDDKGNEYIKQAISSSQRMKILITDLLEYSKVNKSKKILKKVNFAVVFKNAVKNLSHTISESKAVITNNPLPEEVDGNSSQLVQLMQNLISNAIKYRSKEQPKIHVKANRTNNEWIFSISDNGIGIDPKYKESIFEIFYRLHSMDKYSGTGIGLAISKKIVEQHNGTLWVESVPAKGSTFYFTLPFINKTESSEQETN